MSGWMQALHATNPYENFPLDQYQPDVQGWGSDSPIFEAVISQARPANIVEVGSWKGASAIHMADLMKKHSVKGQILCVDTWLGGPEVWLGQSDPKLKVPFEFGHPLIYAQFLANVIHRGHTDVIVPLPVDSITGAKILATKGIVADAIYIDGGHDYEHIVADLKAWWPVLKPGGILFGDDYHLLWIGVVRAANDFADKIGVKLDARFPNKWLVQKPQ